MKTLEKVKSRIRRFLKAGRKPVIRIAGENLWRGQEMVRIPVPSEYKKFGWFQRMVMFPVFHQTFVKGSDVKVKRVVLAEDHPKVRAGIRTILEKASDIEVVAEAGDGEEALRLIEEHSPDVLLLDVEMPLMNGLEVARKLKEEGSPVRIIALSAYHEWQYVHRMMENGAAGYLTKEEAPEKIVRAVRGAAQD